MNVAILHFCRKMKILEIFEFYSQTFFWRQFTVDETRSKIAADSDLECDIISEDDGWPRWWCSRCAEPGTISVYSAHLYHSSKVKWAIMC